MLEFQLKELNELRIRIADMKVLYVTGACLTRNTSANMSHNAFVQGMLENGCDVDIIMAKDSWGESDHGLPVWSNATYFVFPSLSFSDKIRAFLRSILPEQKKSEVISTDNHVQHVNKKKSFSTGIRTLGKNFFNKLFKTDPVYPLEHFWLKRAVKFRNEKRYDLIISNSSPAASHRLVVELIEKNNIQFDRWIQIWEDPWFHDLYGKYPSAIEEEEHFLLRKASEVFYVSPLTLFYQKKYYQDCAYKMNCLPLPALKLDENEEIIDCDEYSFGYFGDYYSEARDLRPFYHAAVELGIQCYIYGDSDLSLKKTDSIDISGRVTLDKLKGIQSKTNVLVHLCNLHGGQIPGKIYHYSVTNKPILFILDGTEEEKNELIRFFGAYHRYYFCENLKEDIIATMKQIENEKRIFNPINDFLPEKVVGKLLG